MPIIPLSVKLPYSVSRGSVQKRYELAETMLQSFYESVLPKFSRRRGVRTSELTWDLFNALPDKNINFRILRSKNIVNSTMDTIYDNNRIPKRHDIIIKGSPTDNCTKKDMNALFHEVWHFVEMISNPKFIARTYSFNEKDFDKLFGFYEKIFYSESAASFKFLKENLDKFIKCKKPLEKINILQELRYEIISEINAFTHAHKLAPDIDYVSEYKLKEKLEFITDELKLLFRDARKLDPSNY